MSRLPRPSRSRSLVPSSLSLHGALLLGAGALLGGSCTPCEPLAPVRPDPKPQEAKAEPAVPKGPTEAEARAFMDQTEVQLRTLWSHQQRMAFVQNTYITHDTESLNAQANEQVMEFLGKKIKEAAKYDAVQVSAELRRKFALL